ncbi:MAG: MlaD family protein, partial [Deltaproteobacteria bacterium]|nr:MlaD family protein [Deltaproteobacteria bacterium]
METRINYLLVGIFVLVLGFAFLASIIWLTLRPATHDYNTYLVYTTYSVSGLSPEAPVKYNGVDVGRVARLRLDPENPDQVKILLEIRPNTPVRQNTLATIEMQGLTGIAYLNLTSPSQDAPLLKPSRQEPYPEIQSGPSLLTRMDEGITALLTSLTQTSDSVREFISGPNKVAINKSLGRLEELLDSLSGQTDSMG